MKKILLLSAITLISFSSCKKEEVPATTDLDPALKPIAVQVGIDNYTGQYVRVY